MARGLDDLPFEVVDRVVDYLRNRDALLQLRRASKNLCAKTLDRFSKAYFEIFDCTLNASNMSAICHLSTRPLIVSHLTSIALTAPIRDRSYDNFWMAKNIDPASLAIALNQFSNLRSLRLKGFGFDDGQKADQSFMSIFSDHLAVSGLEQLELHDIGLSSQAATALITMAHGTLKGVSLTLIDLLVQNSTSTRKDEPYPPWTEVLMAMECLSNDCEIIIKSTMVDGKKYEICPPWVGWDCVYYQWKGLELKQVPDDEDDTSLNREETVWIYIAGNANWWEGIKRLLAFAFCDHIERSDLGWETEDHFWQAVKQTDLSWDEKLRKLLQ